MGKRFDSLSADQIAFIGAQPMFFVATTAPNARINLAPKGMDALRVIGPDRILWLNLTGSGNETAAHLAEDDRMTLMWCSFDARPMILRAYGVARAWHRNAALWPDLAAHFPDLPGARQIIEMTVDLVQTSCGYAVPLMAFQAERPVLRHWAEGKGAAGLTGYWAERNATSIDGRPTGIDANTAGDP